MSKFYPDEFAEFPGSEKLVDIILKLLRDGGLNCPISYLMKSWDELQRSDQIRSAAAGYCTGYV